MQFRVSAPYFQDWQMRVLAVVEKEKLKWEQRGQEYAGKGEGMQEIEVDMEADPTKKAEVAKAEVAKGVERGESVEEEEGDEADKEVMVVGMEWVEMEVEVMAKEEAWGEKVVVMVVEEGVGVVEKGGTGVVDNTSTHKL
eukprot:gene4523-5537_t